MKLRHRAGSEHPSCPACNRHASHDILQCHVGRSNRHFFSSAVSGACVPVVRLVPRVHERRRDRRLCSSAPGHRRLAGAPVPRRPVLELDLMPGARGTLHCPGAPLTPRGRHGPQSTTWRYENNTQQAVAGPISSPASSCAPRRPVNAPARPASAQHPAVKTGRFRGPGVQVLGTATIARN